jgi:hypothetical protein
MLKRIKNLEISGLDFKCHITVSVWQVPTLNLIKNTKDWNYEKNLEQNTESICYTQC